MTRKLLVTDLQTEYGNGPVRLVCRAGFEDRSLIVPQALGTIASSAWIFKNKQSSTRSSDILRKIEHALTGMRAKELDVNAPNDIADEMMELAKSIFRQPDDIVTVIDITVFRREELLILLRMLAHFYKAGTRCDLLYVRAATFAQDWLSRNTVEFRSVIGYSGNTSPAGSTHLVVMLGFELERARDIIDNYEPTQITIGCGKSRHDGAGQLYDRNRHLLEELKVLYGDSIHEFEFSLDDPLDTKRDIAKAIGENQKYSYVIAPLNNKISTLGAGLFALEHPSVQICYGVVSEYNEEDYSVPSEEVLLISLADIGLRHDNT